MIPHHMQKRKFEISIQNSYFALFLCWLLRHRVPSYILVNNFCHDVARNDVTICVQIDVSNVSRSYLGIRLATTTRII